jgi:four helix bundle protein
MSARCFEDLVVWRLAHQLQQEVFALTALKSCCLDRNFCDQIRDSSRSVTRNVAAGFRRYRPREFAHFMAIANGSLQETLNHLRDGHDRGYWTRRPTIGYGACASAPSKRVSDSLAISRPPGNQNPENPENLRNPENPENPKNLENPENL